MLVKGKAEPLALFRPLQARARFGTDLTRTQATPLVGRELEKPLLIGTFERSAQQRSCQLVTIVGEPGVGKSRLCAELFAYLEERPGLVRWRQGRCLPYGEGIAFWALGEIVKAECGILESDSPEEAVAKLEQALPADDPDRPWLRTRLQPLVGAGGEPASQEESFTAWRRCLESWAVGRETVLVFEDLHWTDQALLAFLEHLADWAQGVPLLLLCTARPELQEQHPAWAAGLRNATTINLAPLSDEETARLIASLLERAVLPAETQQALLERAGGNPLYAEEFVRLLTDRDLLSGALGEVQVPDSVQALIAARLDTLSPERKSLLQDAAVVGKVFWAGALAEMGARAPREVEHALHELARKELVRPARTSSMEGEAEYGFWHLLLRDVCYSQIPRAARAARHRAAAAWIEGKAGERAEDLADVLAHHYLQALELARAAGQTAETEDLQEAAIGYLALSGERALALDVERAEASLGKALALAPAGHPERASLLERWAQAAQQQGRLKEARGALEEALALHRGQGERVAAGRVLTVHANVLRSLADPRQEETIAEALALLEAQPPGPELVAAHAQLAATRVSGAAYPEAIAAAERALALAAALGLPEPARALGSRGSARAFLGERLGLEDMRRAWLALGMASESLHPLAQLGLAEQALAEAGPLADRLQAAGDVNLVDARSLQLRLLAERGTHEQAPPAEELVDTAREGGEPQFLAIAFAAAGRLLLAQGHPQQAHALLVELDQVAGIRVDPYYASLLPELVRSALALDDAVLAGRLVDGVQPVTPLHEQALAACRAGASSGTCPSAPTPCSARAAVSSRSDSPRPSCRSSKRESYSRQWATSPRSPRPKRCSSRQPPRPRKREAHSVTGSKETGGVGELLATRRACVDSRRPLPPPRRPRRSSAASCRDCGGRIAARTVALLRRFRAVPMTDPHRYRARPRSEQRA